jgi:hypothetical protein
MKKQGVVYISIGTIGLAVMIFFAVIGTYHYERDYESYCPPLDDDEETAPSKNRDCALEVVEGVE